MAPINPKYVAIAHVHKLLSVLIAENNTYLKGQVVFAVDDATGKTGVKVGDWDWKTMDESAGTAFVDLPWIVAPDTAGALGYTPFKVRTTDNNPLLSPYYQVVGADTVITDSRLIGVADPIISSTADGVEWRDEDLVIDAVAGKITILGFAAMDPTEHISIFVPAQITTGGSIAALTARVTAVETLTAPLLAGAKLWWPLAAGLIPEGWQICTAMEGYFPMAIKPGDARFGLPVGTPGGDNAKITLAGNNLPRIKPTIAGSNTNTPHSSGPAAISFPFQKDVDVVLFDIGKDTPDPIDKMPAYLLGYWIELAP